MSKRVLAGLLGIGLIANMLSGCGGAPDPATANKLQVAVSILPQKTFVERIGGDHVTVLVLVGPGASAETYEPKPQQLRALSSAAAYFRMGVSLEDAWFERLRTANTKMLVFDQAQSIIKIPSADFHHATGEAGVETERGDPHVWLSPRLVKIQAQNIAEALIQLDPEHSADYLQNLEDFQKELDALDAEIGSKLSGLANRKFLVVHPAWGYFARDYHLEMISVESEGQEPSAAEMAELITKASLAQVKKIFAQPEFSSRTAEVIAQEIGAKIVLISDLAADWADNLRRLVTALLQ